MKKSLEKEVRKDDILRRRVKDGHGDFLVVEDGGVMVVNDSRETCLDEFSH